jgi:hypothetical protein
MKCPSCDKLLTEQEAEIMKKYNFEICVDCRKKKAAVIIKIKRKQSG